MNRDIKCLIVDDEPVAREIISAYVDRIPYLEKIGECKNVAEALEQLKNQTVDLLFLDINMPEISGLTLAKTLDSKIKVIFTTAYREYAVDGFDLQVLDYLLKPISFERFFKAVQRFSNQESVIKEEVVLKTEEERPDYIFVRSDRKMVKVVFDEVYYIESLSDYIKIHTHQGVIITRETISNVESKLPKHVFIRTHRSYIVSISKIHSFTNEYIEVGHKSIPISRSYKEIVLQKLQEN